MTETPTGVRGAVSWRGFLRALAEEIDSAGGMVARDALLRAVGERMALTRPLPSVPDIASLQIEINGILAEWGWGEAELQLNSSTRNLLIVHYGMPSLSSVGDPPGTWLSGLLEGLYETWLGQIPGADRSLSARRQKVTPVAVTLRYGRN